MNLITRWPKLLPHNTHGMIPNSLNKNELIIDCKQTCQKPVALVLTYHYDLIIHCLNTNCRILLLKCHLVIYNLLQIDILMISTWKWSEKIIYRQKNAHILQFLASKKFCTNILHVFITSKKFSKSINHFICL